MKKAIFSCANNAATQLPDLCILLIVLHYVKPIMPEIATPPDPDKEGLDRALKGQKQATQTKKR